MHGFNPFDWYWVNEDGTVYSSAQNKFYASSNVEYKRWTGAGGMATRFPRNEAGTESFEEMDAVLASLGLPHLPDLK